MDAPYDSNRVELIHSPLVEFARGDHERIAYRLRAIRRAVEAGHVADAGEDLSRWRRHLARHLDWEEHVLGPAFAGCGAAEGRRVAGEHAAEHGAILGLAADAADLLRAERCAAWTPAAGFVLERLERELARHRDHELYGICGPLDERLAHATVRRMERELEPV